jgi:hypothetical protein
MTSTDPIPKITTIWKPLPFEVYKPLMTLLLRPGLDNYTADKVRFVGKMFTRSESFWISQTDLGFRGKLQDTPHLNGKEHGLMYRKTLKPRE